MARDGAISSGGGPPLDEEATLRTLRALRKIAEGVESATGSDFFRSLVRCVSEALGVAYAFVSELDDARRVFRTIAVWGHGRPLDNFELPVSGTPCERVLEGEIAHYVAGVQQRFPADLGLVTWQVEGYCGVPLIDSAGIVLGHLAIFDTQPMPDPGAIAILRIFAARACAEIERQRSDERLRANESRFRDLYQEAPIAYATVGVDGIVRQVNRRTVELYGYFSAEEIVGKRPEDLCPDTPDGKALARNLVMAFLAGREVDDVELECAKADGSPFWVRVSFRVLRDAEGRIDAARTALVDVTDRKRAEAILVESAALYRDLYEEAPVAYITIGVDGRIRNLNGRTLEVFGFTREQSIGHDFLEFLPEPTRERGVALFQRALAGELLDDEEVEALRADGSVFWIRVSARPLKTPIGDVEAFRVTFVDVSARKRVEQALQESETRYRDLYEQAPVAYWFVTHEGKIDRVNRAMAEMFGHPREFFIGRTLYDLYADTPRGVPAALEVRQRFLSGMSVRGVELEARRADGSPLWLRVSVSPLRDASGKVAGGRITAVDVTAQKRVEQAERVSEYLEEEIRAVHNIDDIIGQSPALMAVLEKVRLVADTDSSVLILGETGTGKELVARAVRSASRRKSRPLIKVNCAALPSALIESELFGHEKGAFTGANERRIGRFELADGGTIFLDEIGEVPLEVQVKLLRVLQEREIERVGGSRTIPVDVRVIAATNRDLKSAVAAGKFRQDLYYRLNVFPVEVPALRERPEDIPLLVHHFVARYAAKIGRRVTRVSPDVMARLVGYAWPGNIRELENVIERAVILSSSAELTAVPDLPSSRPIGVPRVIATPSVPHSPPVDTFALDEIERQHILTVLQKSAWRIEGTNGAAELLDLNPSTLRSRIKKLGIQRSREITS